MVIFMPYYRQNGQVVHLHSRSRGSSSSNGQHNAVSTSHATTHMNACKFGSSILCRFSFSLFLFAIALFLFHLSLYSNKDKNDGSNIIAIILLTIAIISFLRTCQILRRYLVIMETRRRLIQRLRERQQNYEFVLTTNTEGNADVITSNNTDLPSYKELFPSHTDIRIISNETSSTLPPPTYDDFVKTLATRQPTTMLPISTTSPTILSLPTTSITTSTNQTQRNPLQYILVNHRTRRPVCIRDTVTYV